MALKFLWRILFMLMLYAPVHAAEPDWRLYAELLQAYTSEEQYADITLTWVDYSGLIRDGRMAQVVAELEQFPLEQLATVQQRKAFYINAYNILALKTVIDHWPVASIKDAGNWLQPVWKRVAGRLGGEPVTLDQIEHRILRPLGDPRVHMAIVCASLSCPDLRAEPYRADLLDQQLDDQARDFLANPSKGVAFSGSAVRLSKIFDWFEKDFAAAGGVPAWVAGYLGRDLPSEYGFLPYRWEVNGS